MTEPILTIGNARIFLGDCHDVLRGLNDCSVDSIVTDPPYELGFMGKKWDSSGIAYDVTVWGECLRVLKPGGHLLAFGGSRTYHRLGVAIEDAGFEIRDTIAWISSKTFPKSLNVEKAMVKAGMDGSAAAGWGTGLKQVVEPVVMARKPLDGTVAENTLRWGVGGINIDASRVRFEAGEVDFARQQKQGADNPLRIGGAKPGDVVQMWKPEGRWPANVILDEVTAGLLDKQSGVTKTTGNYIAKGAKTNNIFSPGIGVEEGDWHKGYGDTGGVSRFFYVAKASKRDRNEGMEIANTHPTVKPTALMRYLIKLVTPPGGTVLDPFTGSGSTGKAALLDGFIFIGAELEEEYIPIIEGRLRWGLEKDKEDGTLF
jgi:site-specific DNA-methyltransferase (adenine-specific)